MIDAPAFEHSHLFLADNEMMKNDVPHRNPSVANRIQASRATSEASMATPEAIIVTPCYRGPQAPVATDTAAVTAYHIEHEAPNRVMGNLKQRVEDDVQVLHANQSVNVSPLIKRNHVPHRGHHGQPEFRTRDTEAFDLQSDAYPSQY